MASMSTTRARARPISGRSRWRSRSSPSIRARRASTNCSSTFRTPGSRSNRWWCRPGSRPARNGRTAGIRCSRRPGHCRASAAVSPRAASTRCAGSCRRSAPPTTSTGMNRSISTCRKTCATIRPISPAVAGRGSPAARRPSMPSPTRENRKAAGPTRAASAPGAASPATSASTRRSTITMSCSTTGCWQSRPIRAASPAAASPAAPRSSSMSAMSIPTGWTPPSPCASAAPSRSITRRRTIFRNTRATIPRLPPESALQPAPASAAMSSLAAWFPPAARCCQARRSG